MSECTNEINDTLLGSIQGEKGRLTVSFGGWRKRKPQKNSDSEEESSDEENAKYESSEVYFSSLVPFGDNHCSYCLCSPCVLEHPPDWFCGQCDPHPANYGKRDWFNGKFRDHLRRLGVWSDVYYVNGKKSWTPATNCCRGICTIPHCVDTEIRRRYPSCDRD